MRLAFTDGRKLEPRVYMMAASIMGAIAFEKGLGAMAMADANMATNPIPMTEDKLRKLLRKALTGRL
jgi:alcohol dehydrogenase class IV